MAFDLFLNGRSYTASDYTRQRSLARIVTARQTFAARETIIESGRVSDRSFYVASGFIKQVVADEKGNQHTVAVHIPGDFIDLQGYANKRVDYGLVALGPVEIDALDHKEYERAWRQEPLFADLVRTNAMLNAAMYRQWIFRLARERVEPRLALFVCELQARLELVGIGRKNVLATPILQQDLGEICGASAIHINRMLSNLRGRGFVTMRRNRMNIHDLAGLQKFCKFDYEYLLIDKTPSPFDDAEYQMVG